MLRITPSLLFDGKAEEAMNFYLSIFPHAKVGEITRHSAAGPGPVGTFLSATFQLEGQEYMVINGPRAEPTMAVSFAVECETQEEVDYFWAKLSEGGETSMCGWLKDKFGFWWQVAPKILGEMLQDKDPAKAQRAMEAMLTMTKIDIAGLRRAYGQA